MSRRQYFRKQRLFGLYVMGCGAVIAAASVMLSWASLGLLAGAVIAAGMGIRFSKQRILCA